jgi:hypothetical protein
MQSFLEDIDAWDVVENKVLKSANVQKNKLSQEKKEANITSFKRWNYLFLRRSCILKVQRKLGIF